MAVGSRNEFPCFLSSIMMILHFELTFVKLFPVHAVILSEDNPKWVENVYKKINSGFYNGQPLDLYKQQNVLT